MPLSEAVSYISIFYISTPIYLIKEWPNVDKKLLKNPWLSSLLSFSRYSSPEIRKPYFLKKVLGVFIILFVLNSLRTRTNLPANPKLKLFF
jgi:hypothetical protein